MTHAVATATRYYDKSAQVHCDRSLEASDELREIRRSAALKNPVPTAGLRASQSKSLQGTEGDGDSSSGDSSGDSDSSSSHPISRPSSTSRSAPPSLFRDASGGEMKRSKPATVSSTEVADGEDMDVVKRSKPATVSSTELAHGTNGEDVDEDVSPSSPKASVPVGDVERASPAQQTEAATGQKWPPVTGLQPAVEREVIRAIFDPLMRRFFQGSRAKTTIRNGRIPAMLQKEIKEYLMKSRHPQAHRLLAYYASPNLRLYVAGSRTCAGHITKSMGSPTCRRSCLGARRMTGSTGQSSWLMSGGTPTRS